MSQQLGLSLSPPMLPALYYFIVSIVVFFLLYFGKQKITRLRKYQLFIAYIRNALPAGSAQEQVLITQLFRLLRLKLCVTH